MYTEEVLIKLKGPVERDFEEQYRANCKSRDMGDPGSINYILWRWKRFVTSLELGYRMSLDEYNNSLWHRLFLEEVLNQAPNSLRERLEPIVDDLDAFFLIMTQEAKAPL